MRLHVDRVIQFRLWCRRVSFKDSKGYAFSSSGNIIAVASSDTDTVFFFRRKADGLFEEISLLEPLADPNSRLDYPHDVSFSQSGENRRYWRLLNVEER